MRQKPFLPLDLSNVSLVLLVCTALAGGPHCGGNGGGSFDGGTQPEIVSVDPDPAGAGELILIRGSGFGDGADQVVVRRGTDVLTVTRWSETALTALLPTSSRPGESQLSVELVGSRSAAIPHRVADVDPVERLAGGAIRFLSTASLGGLPINELPASALPPYGRPPQESFHVPAQIGATLVARVLAHELRRTSPTFEAGPSTEELLASTEDVVDAVARVLTTTAYVDASTGGRAFYQVHLTPSGAVPRGSAFERTIPFLDNAELVIGLRVAALYLRSYHPALAERIENELLPAWNFAMWRVGDDLALGAPDDPRAGPVLDRLVAEGRLAVVTAAAHGSISVDTLRSVVASMAAGSAAASGSTRTSGFVPYFGTGLEIWSVLPFLRGELATPLGTTLVTLGGAHRSSAQRLGLAAAGATGVADGFGNFRQFGFGPAEVSHADLDRAVLVPPAAGMAVALEDGAALANLKATYSALLEARALDPLYGAPNAIAFEDGLVNERDPVRGTLEMAQMAIALLDHLLGPGTLEAVLRRDPAWDAARRTYEQALAALP